MNNYLTISQVAKLVGINPQTIRRWDKTGKFVSSRHPINNYRVYMHDQVERLWEELNPEKVYRLEFGMDKRSMACSSSYRFIIYLWIFRNIG